MLLKPHINQLWYGLRLLHETLKLILLCVWLLLTHDRGGVKGWAWQTKVIITLNIKPTKQNFLDPALLLMSQIPWGKLIFSQSCIAILCMLCDRCASSLVFSCTKFSKDTFSKLEWIECYLQARHCMCEHIKYKTGVGNSWTWGIAWIVQKCNKNGIVTSDKYLKFFKMYLFEIFWNTFYTYSHFWGCEFCKCANSWFLLDAFTCAVVQNSLGAPLHRAKVKLPGIKEVSIVAI